MKIQTITYTKRHNEGNYNHSEYTISAAVEEGETAIGCIRKLQSIIDIAISGKGEEIKEEVKEEVKSEPVVEAPVVEPVKEKKARAKKEKPVEVVEAEPVVEEKKEEVKPKSKVVGYDSNIPEHKSIFGGYLAKKYGNAWKTAKPVEEIKAFTASLNGKDFIDADGVIQESFLELVHAFFG